MRLSVGARLMVASDGENRKIHAEPDENRAEGNADHAESPEKKLPQSESNQAGEEKAECHSQ